MRIICLSDLFSPPPKKHSFIVQRYKLSIIAQTVNAQADMTGCENPPPPKSCPVLFSLMFNKKRPYVSLWRKERRTLVYCLGKIKMTNYFVSQLPIRTQKLQVLIQSPEAGLSESPQTRVTMMGKSRITDQFNTVTNKLTVKSDRHKWPNTSSLPTLLTELHLNWVCGVVASPPPFLRLILIHLWHRHGLLCS